MAAGGRSRSPHALRAPRALVLVRRETCTTPHLQPNGSEQGHVCPLAPRTRHRPASRRTAAADRGQRTVASAQRERASTSARSLRVRGTAPPPAEQPRRTADSGSRTAASERRRESRTPRRPGRAARRSGVCACGVDGVPKDRRSLSSSRARARRRSSGCPRRAANPLLLAHGLFAHGARSRRGLAGRRSPARRRVSPRGGRRRSACLRSADRWSGLRAPCAAGARGPRRRRRAGW